MKKFIYLLTVVAAMTACNNGVGGYTINGSVEGAADGDSVILLKSENRQRVKIDGTTVKDGAFTLTGKQDTAAVYYIAYGTGTDNSMMLDFFLENGEISVNLNQENPSATGTINNNALQAVRDEASSIQAKMSQIKEALSDTTLTDEKKKELNSQMESFEDQINNIEIEGCRKNITNEAGIYMLKSNYYYMDAATLEEITNMIPEKFSSDPSIIRIKDLVDKKKATAEGQKFTDFSMPNPDGKNVSLSDYAGKGKVVLVDFWASWCPPCRREMPNLVELYKQYSGKGFEIVGVSLDRAADAWKKGIEELGITWPQMSDVKYWDCEAAKIYAVNSIPHTLLIDKDGTIIARGLQGSKLSEKISELMK